MFYYDVNATTMETGKCFIMMSSLCHDNYIL